MNSYEENDQKYSVNCDDESDERYPYLKGITASFKGVVIVYDVTDPQSLKEAIKIKDSFDLDFFLFNRDFVPSVFKVRVFKTFSSP